jgi:hypothetical protein
MPTTQRLLHEMHLPVECRLQKCWHYSAEFVRSEHREGTCGVWGDVPIIYVGVDELFFEEGGRDVVEGSKLADGGVGDKVKGGRGVVEGAEAGGVLAPGLGGNHGTGGLRGVDAVGWVDAAADGEVGVELASEEVILPP